GRPRQAGRTLGLYNEASAPYALGVRRPVLNGAPFLEALQALVDQLQLRRRLELALVGLFAYVVGDDQLEQRPIGFWYGPGTFLAVRYHPAGQLTQCSAPRPFGANVGGPVLNELHHGVDARQSMVEFL